MNGKIIEAIHRDGLLYPLEPLDLAEGTCVRVEILNIEAEVRGRSKGEEPITPEASRSGKVDG